MYFVNYKFKPFLSNQSSVIQTNVAPKILLTSKNSILSLAQLPQTSSTTSTATLNLSPATSSILILNSPQSSNTQNFLTLLPKTPEPIMSSTVKVSPLTVKTAAVPKKNTPGPASKTAVKLCEFCKKKTSQFLCAGCSNRSYCSRTCQERDWDSHADRCL